MTERERLVELLEEAGSEWNSFIEKCLEENEEPHKTYDELHADYLLQNGVICPPCKVGETVYVLWYSEEKKQYELLENTVWNFAVDEYGLCVNTNNIEMGMFGKLVFLAREEAEKALQKIKQRR